MPLLPRAVTLALAAGTLSLPSCPSSSLSRASSTPDEAPQAATARPLERAPALPIEDPGEWPEPEGEASGVLDSIVPVDDVQHAHRDGTVATATYHRVEDQLDPDRVLVSIAKETIVRAEPRWGARKIGYLRAGAIVTRSAEAVTTHHCSGGWYQIAPEGFVCAGKTAALDPLHPIAVAAGHRPDRKKSLPYVYGRSRFPTPPFYVRVPTPKQQRQVEVELAKHQRLQRRDAWEGVELGRIPPFLADNEPARTLRGYTHSRRSIYTGRARPNSGFAMVSLFESHGRKFGLTVDMDVVPLDRLKPVTASEFGGVELNDEVTLPVAFTRTKYGVLYAGDPRSIGLSVSRRLGYREAVAVSSRRARVGSVVYRATTDGGWLREDHLVVIEPMKRVPGWAKPGRTWIDVSILRQTLVAYVGTKPVFATLVSTGADGLGDPEKTHSTKRGRFLIHTKHVTATMSGDEVGDEFDLRDVPYVQYFTEGYALHASYWHDSFGKPRSHGCINLSPKDARWLFEWTDPHVPAAWHGAMSLHNGTLVSVHP